jgi:hypothetical protein
MKLSEQYKKKLTKLIERDLPSSAIAGKTKDTTSTSLGVDQGLEPTIVKKVRTGQPITPMEYAIGGGIAASAIIGTVYLSKTKAGQAVSRLFTHGTLSPYGWYKRFRNTSKVNRTVAGRPTDTQLKQMYENLRKAILQRSRVSIDKTIALVRNGDLTPTDALMQLKKYPLTHLEPDAELDLITFLKRKYNTGTEPFIPAFIPQVPGSGFSREFRFPNISQKDWDALPVETQNALKQNVDRKKFLANKVNKDDAKQLAMSDEEKAASKQAASDAKSDSLKANLINKGFTFK